MLIPYALTNYLVRQLTLCELPVGCTHQDPWGWPHTWSTTSSNTGVQELNHNHSKESSVYHTHEISGLTLNTMQWMSDPGISENSTNYISAQVLRLTEAHTFGPSKVVDDHHRSLFQRTFEPLDNFGLQRVADEQLRCSRGMPERLGHLGALKPLLGQLSDHWDTKPVYFLASFTSQPTYLASEFPIITTIAIHPQEIQEIQPPYALHWEYNFQQMKFHEWLDIDTLPHSCMFNRCF